MSEFVLGWPPHFTAIIFLYNLGQFRRSVRSTFILHFHLLRSSLFYWTETYDTDIHCMQKNSHFPVYWDYSHLVLIANTTNMDLQHYQIQLHGKRDYKLYVLFWSPEIRVSTRRPMYDLAKKWLGMFLYSFCLVCR